MTKNTKATPGPDRFVYVLHTVSFVIVLLIWLLILIYYNTLPDTIPVHYNFSGVADGFGPKNDLFLLAAIAAIMFLIVYFSGYLIRFLKHSGKVPGGKELNQLDNSCRMLAGVNLVLSLTFGYIALRTIQLANGAAGGLGVWFAPLFVLAVLGVLVFYSIRIIRA